jgi:hypothetical protein
MTRLKPIGLTEADRQNPEESITPDRVKKLIDLYKKNHYNGQCVGSAELISILYRDFLQVGLCV